MISRARQETYCERAASRRFLPQVFAAHSFASAIRLLGVSLLVALNLLLTFVPPAFSQNTGSSGNAGQDATGINPKTLAPIDATKTNPRNFPTYRLNFEKIERYEAKFEIKGDGERWRVVKFHKIPADVTVRLDGIPSGYDINDELIVENKWYPFMRGLPLTIAIPKSVQLPLAITYELNFIRVPKEGLNSEQARELVKMEGTVEGVQPELRIVFQDANSPPTPTPTVSPVPTFPSGIEEEAVSIPLWMLLGVPLALGILILFIVKARKNSRRSFGREPARGATRQSGRQRPISMDYDKLGGPMSNVSSGRAQDITAYEKEKRGGFFSIFKRKGEVKPSHIEDFFPPKAAKPSGTSGTVRQEKKATSVQPTSVIRQPAAADKARPPAVTSAPSPAEQWWPQPQPSEPASQPGVGTPRESTKLDQAIESRLSEHSNQITRLKFADQDLKSELHWLKDELDAQKELLRGDIQPILAKLKSELTQVFRGDLDTVFSQLTEALAKQQQQTEQAQKSSENALKYMQEQVWQLEEKTKSQAAAFEQREKQQHDAYSDLLGGVLGLNVETLRAGKFDELVKEAGRNLDRFFQEQVPYADGLEELQQKAEAISSALEAAVSKARNIKPDMRELQPHIDAAKKLTSELAMINWQLHSRHLTFQTTLSLPVGAYQGARDTFLEELGKAVKREIDKLRDPRRHWSKELERLTTSSILAITDICDIDVMGRPGANKELEQSLGELFKQAGLRPIMPEPGTDFKPREQHLIQMVAGSPADSQKIKRVVRRGFYYIMNGKEQLIRKAGVEVYR